MNEAPALSQPLVQLLEDLRKQLNATFQQTILTGARIEPTVWLDHVRTYLLPIVDSVQRVQEERAKVTAIELYEVLLELVSKQFFSESGSCPWLRLLWQKILPDLPTLVGRDPRRVVGKLSNATVYLKQISEACVQRWLHVLSEGAKKCETPHQLLDFGNLAAWSSGVAEFRLPALKLAQALPTVLVRTALRIPETVPDEQVRNFLNRMETNPWTKIPGGEHADSQSTDQVSEVAVCGDFIGLGGSFRSPPTVFLSNGRLHTSDQEGTWLLIADRFGSSLQRTNSVAADSSPPKMKVAIDKAGKISWFNQTLARPDLRNCSSSCFDGQTFAVTIPSSYRIYLFAASGET